MRYQEIISRLKDKGPDDIGACRSFSVLIPLTASAAGLNVLFEVRSKDIKRQPGEICLPGGMKEKGETDFRCAVRETGEELGLDQENIHIDAELGELRTAGGDVIRVYAGMIETAGMNPSAEEVAEVFTVPLDFFLENEPEMYYTRITSEPEGDFPLDRIGFPGGYPWRVAKGEVPVYEYDNHVIWVSTGRIIKHFTERIKG